MSKRLIQDLHAGISRRDWNAVELAANRLRDDVEKTLAILAGTGIGSLPDDYPLSELSTAALTAAFAAMPGPAVKALVWERGVVDWARPLPGMKYVACSSEPHPYWYWWLDSAEGPISHNRCDSEAIAKAAAQADYEARILSALTPAPDLASENERLRAFKIGDTVKKRSGSWWEGRVVGFYSTEQTSDGVCVQLDKPLGPVQIYPAAALERT